VGGLVVVDGVRRGGGEVLIGGCGTLVVAAAAGVVAAGGLDGVGTLALAAVMDTSAVRGAASYRLRRAAVRQITALTASTIPTVRGCFLPACFVVLMPIRSVDRVDVHTPVAAEGRKVAADQP